MLSTDELQKKTTIKITEQTRENFNKSKFFLIQKLNVNFNDKTILNLFLKVLMHPKQQQQLFILIKKYLIKYSDTKINNKVGMEILKSDQQNIKNISENFTKMTTIKIFEYQTIGIIFFIISNNKYYKEAITKNIIKNYNDIFYKFYNQ